MKNITVSVSDDVYRAARIRAAERGQSVSALVSDYLRSLSEEGIQFARLEAEQERILQEITEFRAGERLSRDEIHDRAVR
jgi:plasmid stability protein